MAATDRMNWSIRNVKYEMWSMKCSRLGLKVYFDEYINRSVLNKTLNKIKAVSMFQLTSGPIKNTHHRYKFTSSIQTHITDTSVQVQMDTINSCLHVISSEFNSEYQGFHNQIQSTSYDHAPSHLNELFKLRGAT